MADDRPPDKSERGNDQHSWHENAGNGIGQALDGCLRALRLLDHADDARQQRIRSYFRGAHAQETALVDGRTDHRVSLALVNGQAFAGNHRLID